MVAICNGRSIFLFLFSSSFIDPHDANSTIQCTTPISKLNRSGQLLPPTRSGPMKRVALWHSAVVTHLTHENQCQILSFIDMIVPSSLIHLSGPRGVVNMKSSKRKTLSLRGRFFRQNYLTTFEFII